VSRNDPELWAISFGAFVSQLSWHVYGELLQQRNPRHPKS
jgi:hypothetical protein